MKLRSKNYFIGLMLILFLSAGSIYASEIKGIPVSTKNLKAKELLIKARDAREMGNLLMAQELGKKAIAEDARFAYAYFELAYSSNSTQSFKANLEMANKNYKYCSEAEQILIKIGLSYFNANWEDRLSLVNKLVSLKPESSRAWIYLADVYTENNQIEEARKSLEKAISLDESFHYAYQQLGFSYLNRKPNDFNKATENMKQALALVPESGRAYINLGDALRGGSKLKMARDNYSKAIEIDSENALAYLKRAHANLFLDELENAKKDYHKAVQLADDINLVIYSNYAAFTEIYKGKMMTAFDELNLALEKVNNLDITESQKLGQKIFTLQNMIMLCIHSEQHAKAEECLLKYSEHVKKRLESIQSERYTLGQKAGVKLYKIYFLAQKGYYTKAYQQCEEVKEIYKKLDNEILMENYYGAQAYVLFKEKKYKDAILSFQKSDLNEIFNKYYLGMAYEENGEKPKAKQLYEEVAGFNFNSVEYALLRKSAMKKIKFL